MLEFGIFDHVDAGNRSLAAFYGERLKLVEQMDRLGFYGYHVAEHHFTPLGLASSPSVYLSAVAQRTRKLRFGPLVYTLPLYHPLRLAEEICMLDQMSEGRLDVGVGRGISPIEASFYGAPTDVGTSREVHQETLEIVKRAITGGSVTFEGKHRTAANIQMQLASYQKPHPPFWMGVASAESAEAAARDGYNFVASAPASAVQALNARYLEVWKNDRPEKTMDTKRGLLIFVVVAETDGQAQEIAARAYRVWHRNFNYLYSLQGRSPVKGHRPAEFGEVQAQACGIAGSPQAVANFLQKQIADSRCNYFVGQFIFGDLAYAEGARSLELFSSAVMPVLSARSTAGA